MSQKGQATEEKKVSMGSFSFIYDRGTDQLQIQVFNKNTLQYDSVLQIDANGNLKITGALTTSTTLTSYGRY